LSKNVLVKDRFWPQAGDKLFWSNERIADRGVRASVSILQQRVVRERTPGPSCLKKNAREIHYVFMLALQSIKSLQHVLTPSGSGLNDISTSVLKCYSSAKV